MSSQSTTMSRSERLLTDLEACEYLYIVSKVSMRPNANGRKGFRVDAFGTHGNSRPVWEWKQPCHEG